MAWRRGGGRGLWIAISLLGFVGCGGDGAGTAAPTYPYIGVELTVGVVGDPAVAGFVSDALRGEWEATRKATVKLVKEPSAASEASKLDVILFAGDHVGELVDAGALTVWPERLVLPPAPREEFVGTAAAPKAEPEADSFQFSDVVQTYRDQVTKYGSDRIGVPLGGTGLVLAYDKQAFSRAENQQAAEKDHVRLAPPTTWKELDDLARFFEGRDWNGDGRPDHGIALVLGNDADGLGNAIFLARAASAGQHKDQYSFLFDSDSMAPRIATAPFVETLEAMVALRKCGPAKMEAFDGTRARRALAEGEVALLIDLAEHADAWAHKQSIGVAGLPGSERVYDPIRQRWETVDSPNRPSYLPRGGGWLVGVSARCKGTQREAAIDLAKYLTGPDPVATQIRSGASVPTLPVRTTLLGQGPNSARTVDARQWADAVGQTLAAVRVIPGLRIPGADGYLSDLAVGRVAALEGQPAEAALKGVAKAWEDRTQRLGTERQAWHYQRSLNSVVTTAKPPPR